MCNAELSECLSKDNIIEFALQRDTDSKQCGEWIGGGSDWREGDQPGGDFCSLKKYQSKLEQLSLTDKRSIRDPGYDSCYLCRLQSFIDSENIAGALGE